MSEQQAKNPADLTTIVKSMAEFVVPGGSLMASGDVRQGIFHLVGGVVAKAILGVPGLLLVRANSLSNFYSGKHLHKHLRRFQDPPEDESQRGGQGTA